MSQTPSVDVTKEDIEAALDVFASLQESDGVAAANTMRMRVGAVKMLLPMLKDNEPRNAGYLLENLDELHRRWRDQNPVADPTAESYLGRARRLLTDYVNFMEKTPRPANVDPSISEANLLVWHNVGKSGNAKPMPEREKFLEYVRSLEAKGPTGPGPMTVQQLKQLRNSLAHWNASRHSTEQMLQMDFKTERTVLLDDGKRFTYSYSDKKSLTVDDITKIVISLLSSDSTDGDITKLPLVFETFQKLKKKES